jgi:hypothetical protein
MKVMFDGCVYLQGEESECTSCSSFFEAESSD